MARFKMLVRRRANRLLYLPPVLFNMLAMEVAVRCLPLDTLSRLMGVPLDSTTTQAPVPADKPQLTRWQAGQLRTLVPVAAHWPLADGPCLRQALVAGHILRHHHPVLRLGVAPGTTEVQAHAWVEVGGVLVGDSRGFIPLINDRDRGPR
jgi:hypothetical protein